MRACVCDVDDDHYNGNDTDAPVSPYSNRDGCGSSRDLGSVSSWGIQP